MVGDAESAYLNTKVAKSDVDSIVSKIKVLVADAGGDGGDSDDDCLDAKEFQDKAHEHSAAGTDGLANVEQQISTIDGHLDTVESHSEAVKETRMKADDVMAAALEDKNSVEKLTAHKAYAIEHISTVSDTIAKMSEGIAAAVSDRDAKLSPAMAELKKAEMEMQEPQEEFATAIAQIK